MRPSVSRVTAVPIFVCKRSNTPDWLKNIQVGYRFILRGTVTNLVGIVIAIHVLQRRVDALSAAKDGRSVVFNTMEIPATVIENLQSLPSESPWHALFDAHGYCVNCHLTFKVKSATGLDDTTSLNNQITRERTILSELIQSKKARKQTKPTSREMVELAATIKRQEKLIWQLNKKREVVPAWRAEAKAAAQKRAFEEAEEEEKTANVEKKAKVVDATSFATYGLSEHMPPTAVHLVHLFSSLEFSLTTLQLYHRTADFPTIKAAVESSSKCTFTIQDFARIVTVYPEAYDLSFTKPTDNTLPELCIKTASLSFPKRMTTFCTALNDKLAEFLASNPTADDFEVPEASLPPAEEAMGPTPIAQLRSQEVRHAAAAAALTPLEQAAFLAKPLPKELEGLPSWLVRTAEWQRNVLKNNAADGANDRFEATLPQLCDQIQAYSVFTGKTAFELDKLVQNLNKAPIPDKIKEQIERVAEMVPFWLTVVESDKTRVVRLNPKQRYPAVKQIISQSVKLN
ncbi:hypothetical protein AeMF1_000862 [Aphanomyces euteiches]|nr:hypothetical protein AeMF1_000862 [Aphanomyces euteiches]